MRRTFGMLLPLLLALALVAPGHAGSFAKRVTETPAARAADTPRTQAAKPGRAAKDPVLRKRAEQPVAVPTDHGDLTPIALPDLTVSVAQPASTSAPAQLVVQNQGPGHASGFLLKVELEYACEAGKLIAPAGSQQFAIGSLGAGATTLRSFSPPNGFTASGCYNRLTARVDALGQVGEGEEGNNAAHGHWCFASSCY